MEKRGSRYLRYALYNATNREDDEHPALLVQPAVFHGQAHAVDQDAVQRFGIG